MQLQQLAQLYKPPYGTAELAALFPLIRASLILDEMGRIQTTEVLNERILCTSVIIIFCVREAYKTRTTRGRLSDAKLKDSLTVRYESSPLSGGFLYYHGDKIRELILRKVYQESEVRPNDKDTERSPVQPRDMKRLRIQNDTLSSQQINYSSVNCSVTCSGSALALGFAFKSQAFRALYSGFARNLP